jgi:hypothetical protein
MVDAVLLQTALTNKVWFDVEAEGSDQVCIASTDVVDVLGLFNVSASRCARLLKPYRGGSLAVHKSGRPPSFRLHVLFLLLPSIGVTLSASSWRSILDVLHSSLLPAAPPLPPLTELLPAAPPQPPPTSDTSDAVAILDPDRDLRTQRLLTEDLYRSMDQATFSLISPAPTG